ncbi:MAG: hypothetical protein GY715_09790 [Planctomycetes bacterium]|nr:hypothetical protein [Planctomycetota bacterium]
MPTTFTTFRLVWLVAWVSAAALGFEIALMRVLLVASWHHFAFLVISVALLGFGVSGTVLCLGRRRLLAHATGALGVLALLTAISMPVVVAVARHIPVEGRLVAALAGRQVGAWIGYWLLLLVPFVFAAMVIGLALMTARRRVATVYAANLLGSAIGAVAIMLAMDHVAPAWLPVVTGAAALVAIVPWPMRGRLVATAAVVLGAGAWLALDPPEIRVDPYKYGAHVARLEAQGDAERVAQAWSPRGVVEIFRGDTFHELPFLSVNADPPRLAPIVIDGHWSGAVLAAGSPDAAAVVDDTLPSVPYALLDDGPKAVLLLGEVGGANAWLAVRRGASAVDWVQPDAKLVALLDALPDDDGSAVIRRPDVHMVIADPRHFLARPPRRYGLIQLVAIESMSAGSGGVGGLGENHLVTVQGLAAALRALDDDGTLTVCRGIQSPPRDNLKLLGTLTSALGSLGVEQPREHVVIVRDYLAVCTMVRREPWPEDTAGRVRDLCATRDLTPVWFPGIRADELNRPDELPGPPDAPGDWYHHAAARVTPDGLPTLARRWMFDIRPPTDDRPFFGDFCRLRGVAALRLAFGDLWLTRAELAYLFALAATTLIGVVAAAVTLLPLAALRSVRRARGKRATAAYFTAIGLGYLLLEMVLLSRLTHLIGDPVRAAATTIASFLLFSGVGSLLAQRFPAAPVRRLIGALVVLGVLVLVAIVPVATHLAGGAPLAARCVVAVAVTAPLALLMGLPMPTALMRLDRAAPALIPWAWGLNGFASVLAAPLAVVLAMTWGYWVTAAVALAVYLVAALVFARLPYEVSDGGPSSSSS